MHDVRYASASESVERLCRGLHDGPLQLLDYMCTGGYGAPLDAHEYQLLSSRAAHELRRVLQGCEACDTVSASMERIVADVEVLDPAITVHVDIACDCMNLRDGRVGTTMLAVGEAVRNASLHAAASQVHVTCERSSGRMLVTVRDDGDGLPKDVRPGFGIRHSIIGRMHELGGSARFEPACPRGTRVRLELPLGSPSPVARSPLESQSPARERVVR